VKQFHLFNNLNVPQNFFVIEDVPINEKIFFVSGRNEQGDFVDSCGYVVNGLVTGLKKTES
jgi:hypothetical protein